MDDQTLTARKLLLEAEELMLQKGHVFTPHRGYNGVSLAWNTPPVNEFFGGKRTAFFRCRACKAPVKVSPDGKVSGAGISKQCTA
jgi:hypothetical protein